ncbi:MAG: cytochrome c-type biogenesis protein [Peptococcaceae bacterium]
MQYKKRIVHAGLVLFLFFSFAAVPLTSAEISVMQKETEEMLVCQDDCGMLVSACDNPTATYMRGIITEQIGQGKSREEILQYFVSVYGEQVLATPEPQGFNMTAYVIPFAAILMGGIVIYSALEKWVLHNRLSNFDLLTAAKGEKADEQVFQKEYEEKLERELKKYW